MSLTNLLLYIYYISLSLAIIAGSIRINSFGKAEKILWMTLLLSGIAELIRAPLLGQNHFINNILVNAVLVIELIGYFLFLLYTFSIANRYLLLIIYTASLCFAFLINITLFQPLPKQQTNIYQLESFLITICALISVYKIACVKTTRSLIKVPLFWLWSFILFYQAVTLSYWGCVQLIGYQYPELKLAINNIQVSLNIIQYAGMSIVFFCLYSKKVTS